MEVGTRVRVKHLGLDSWPTAAVAAILGKEGVVEEVSMLPDPDLDDVKVLHGRVKLDAPVKPFGPESRTERDSFYFRADEELEVIAPPAPGYEPPAPPESDLFDADAEGA